MNDTINIASLCELLNYMTDHTWSAKNVGLYEIEFVKTSEWSFDIFSINTYEDSDWQALMERSGVKSEFPDLKTRFSCSIVEPYPELAAFWNAMAMKIEAPIWLYGTVDGKVIKRAKFEYALKDFWKDSILHLTQLWEKHNMSEKVTAKEHFDFTIEDALVKKFQVAIDYAIESDWSTADLSFECEVYRKNETTLKNMVEELKSKGFNAAIIECDDDDVKIKIGGW